ncbi:hypothetical protein chiPu_0014118 [Chiloscyllium punctatum]|uniref:Uncharacterized protein n=1 Tax=Chiloscyllium punctatum TaxID=137246 RepID=A0A401SYZ9_CHIPU|nr:hypothetical protein [Chiloscyllium punctatum]
MVFRKYHNEDGSEGEEMFLRCSDNPPAQSLGSESGAEQEEGARGPAPAPAPAPALIITRCFHFHFLQGTRTGDRGRSLSEFRFVLEKRSQWRHQR